MTGISSVCIGCASDLFDCMKKLGSDSNATN